MKFNSFLPAVITATGIAVASTFAPAYAVPSLQLGIVDGEYDESDESIFTTEEDFDLTAYCDPNSSQNDCEQTHYISIAILDEDGNAVTEGTDFGFFVFDGVTYDYNDIIFGTPPEGDPAGADSDPGDLASHGVYETSFVEYDFTFTGNTTASVNTQDDPSYDPTANPGDDLYYELFAVDTSGLSDGYILHFDLYNQEFKEASRQNPDGDLDTDDFAPFSHDAYADGGDDGTEDIPEPGTMAGLGFVAAGLTLMRRRKSS